MVDEVMCMDGRHGMVRLVLSTARWTVNVECDGDLHVEYQIKDRVLHKLHVVMPRGMIQSRNKR